MKFMEQDRADGKADLQVRTHLTARGALKQKWPIVCSQLKYMVEPFVSLQQAVMTMRPPLEGPSLR